MSALKCYSKKVWLPSVHSKHLKLMQERVVNKKLVKSTLQQINNRTLTLEAMTLIDLMRY